MKDTSIEQNGMGRGVKSSDGILNTLGNERPFLRVGGRVEYAKEFSKKGGWGNMLAPSLPQLSSHPAPPPPIARNHSFNSSAGSFFQEPFLQFTGRASLYPFPRSRLCYGQAIVTLWPTSVHPVGILEPESLGQQENLKRRKIIPVLAD